VHQKSNLFSELTKDEKPVNVVQLDKGDIHTNTRSCEQTKDRKRLNENGQGLTVITPKLRVPLSGGRMFVTNVSQHH